MPDIHHPKRGSHGYSPRKRARAETPHIKSWPEGMDKPKIQGFLGYKAGMTHAFIVDYKTGSNKYPDPKQLRLMSLMTFAHFPEVNKIKAGLLFVMHNSFVTEEYERKDIDKSWDKFKGPLERLNNSYETNSWPPNYTPLCRYCPVKTCDFNQG